MIEFFIGGILLYSIMFIFRITVVYLLSVYYKEDFNNNFDFNINILIFEAITYGAIFSLFYLLVNLFQDEPLINILISIFFISLIPSYLFLISPLQYLVKRKEYYDDEAINKLINNKLPINYNIKVINKNIINAYATGVIPFSKTILIGKPLVDKLNKNELTSIVLHEAGHLKLNHLGKLYSANLLLSAISYLLFLIRSEYFHYPDNATNLFSVGITGCLVGLLLWYFPGKLQYTYEYQSDTFSANINGKENLINSLMKIDELSGGDVSKGGITHPSLSKRIQNIERTL